jgi:hypothetical protein
MIKAHVAKMIIFKYRGQKISLVEKSSRYPYLEAGHAEDVLAGHADRLYEDGEADGTHEVSQVDPLPLSPLQQGQRLRHFQLSETCSSGFRIYRILSPFLKIVL